MDCKDYDLGNNKFILKLYVAGMSPRSISAIENLRNICDQNLKNHYTLEIIDIHKNPKIAVDEQIVASPTLIKKLPPPLRTLIGDLSDKEKVLVGLDITEQHNQIQE